MSRLLRDDPWSGSERAPTAVYPVVAWRRWRLRPNESGEPLLASAHEDFVWLDRTVQAVCNPTRTWSYRMASGGAIQADHPVPSAGCRCGIYAYQTPELARPMGPGVWVHGRVLVGGPMFLTDSGYRGRVATIDGPLDLVVECVGGDDLYSPKRCFEEPVLIKYATKVYSPLCESHREVPVAPVVSGAFTVADFADAAAQLAHTMGTLIAAPVPL